MDQPPSSSSYKKRNYTSPQKTQTSIIADTNQKAQKKLNSNTTPPRSALQRAQEAILGFSSPLAANKNMALGNNPYDTLSQDDNDEEKSPVESLGMNQELGSPPKGAHLDNASSLASEKTDDTVSTSSMTIFFQEKVLLSRKAQQALRKLRLARKALTDSSIREELEAVYGVENANLLAETMLELNHQPSLEAITDKDTYHECQESEDMMIDNPEEAANEDKKERTARK
jgi:hypothetical protein